VGQFEIKNFPDPKNLANSGHGQKTNQKIKLLDDKFIET